MNVKDRPNILFLIVDDLRPELGCSHLKLDLPETRNVVDEPKYIQILRDLSPLLTRHLEGWDRVGGGKINFTHHFLFHATGILLLQNKLP